MINLKPKELRWFLISGLIDGRGETRSFSFLQIRSLFSTLNITIVLIYRKRCLLPVLSKCLDQIPSDFFKKLKILIIPTYYQSNNLKCRKSRADGTNLFYIIERGVLEWVKWICSPCFFGLHLFNTLFLTDNLFTVKY